MTVMEWSQYIKHNWVRGLLQPCHSSQFYIWVLQDLQQALFGEHTNSSQARLTTRFTHVVCSARRFCEICDGTRDHSVMTTRPPAVAGISAWHFEQYGAGSWLDVQIYPLGAFANVWTAVVRLVIRCFSFRPALRMEQLGYPGGPLLKSYVGNF